MIKIIYLFLSDAMLVKNVCIGISNAYIPTDSKKFKSGMFGNNILTYDIAKAITDVTKSTFNVILNFSIICVCL